MQNLNTLLHMKSQRKKYIDKKLLFKLRLFAIIFLIMACIGVYDIMEEYIGIFLALSALALGILIGLLVGRANNILWHHEDEKAISKMDTFGICVLIAYTLLAIFRKKIFGHWLGGNELSGFIIWFSSGVMLGRLLTMRRMVIKVLKGQGL